MRDVVALEFAGTTIRIARLLAGVVLGTGLLLANASVHAEVAGQASTADEAEPNASVLQSAKDAVGSDPRVDARGIEISENEGIVTLGGTTPYLGREAVCALDRTNDPGIRGVVDQVDVVSVE